MKSYDLPVVILVMNNTVLGMVRQWQKLFYGNRFSQTDPHRAIRTLSHLPMPLVLTV